MSCIRTDDLITDICDGKRAGKRRPRRHCAAGQGLIQQPGAGSDNDKLCSAIVNSQEQQSCCP